MTTPTMPAEVVDNGDGSYTLPCPRSTGDWTISYEEVTYAERGWVGRYTCGPEHTLTFATPEDAARAVLFGNPDRCRLHDGRTYGEVYG